MLRPEVGGGGLCMVCWCFSLISKWPGGPGSIGSPSVWAVGPRLPAILQSEGGRHAAPLRRLGHHSHPAAHQEATAVGLWEEGPSPGEGGSVRAKDTNTAGSLRTE